MRGAGRILAAGLMTVVVMHGGVAAATSYDERPAATRALFTAVAVAANVLPGVSALYAPHCLPGYVVCKLSFAGLSLLAAGDQFFFAGDADLTQTRAILYRGFGGDWILTGRHVAGERTPEPHPEPPPANGGSTWQPPPL